MKPKSIKSLLALALLAPGVLFAQTTAKTTPVGYVTLGNQDSSVADGSNLPAGSDSYISLPLDRPSVASVAVASVADGVVNFAGTPLASLDLLTQPHVLKIESGTLSGQYALITAESDSSVTVPADLIAGLALGDKVTVRPAWTLGTLFASSNLPTSGIQVFAFDGTEVGVNIQPNNSWAWDGSNWNNNLSLELDDNAVLYPGEAIIVRNESTTNVASLVVSGEVIMSNARQSIVGADVKQDNPFGFQASVGEPVLTSGISSVAQAGDSILIIPNNLVLLNKAAAKTLDYDGTGWADSESLEYIDNTTLFESGVAYIYRREAGSGNGSFSNTPDYVPTL
jgi:uncharacterized protein (TIGR02597 family)